jgi:2,4-dienoyl-CoA reductase-like NADH-dependent reductase (Old Yellow Enzyme family)/thioredoxin reductase
MNKFYPNLLSPLKVGKYFYKNRMGFPRAVPNVVSGALSGDVLESLGLYLSKMAENGASVVCANSATWGDSPLSRPLPPGARPPFADKSYDLREPNTQLKMCRVVESIHNYGSLACMSLMQIEPNGWTVNDLTEEVMDGIADSFAEKCAIYQGLGFDQVCFYMSYNASLLSQSMSPIHNTRTDEYGGSMTNRANFARKVFSRVREKCGSDLIIEMQVSGEEDNVGGYTVSDFAEYVNAVADLIDVVQIRAKNADLAHPLGLNSDKEAPITLAYAEALKKSGADVIVAPVGGYQDPDINERFIAEGKCDFIYMARAFICDYEYVKKISEGRPKDIVPCLRCNSCHSRPNHPDAGCYVNPEMILGLDHNFVVKPADRVKKIAVIGGGPAGIEAALVASQRGHNVTLYERTNQLGGQLSHSDWSPFKWPLREFKDYQAYQLGKSSVDVRMGVEATPELLAGEDYDAIILATGAEHIMPNIPGTDKPNVWKPLDVYGHEAELGKKVVVIGGSETGMETALYLAMAGHDVLELTRNRMLAHDAQPVHFRENFVHEWNERENFNYVTEAKTTAIGDGFVTYVDKDGAEHKIECDSVVACGGLTPRNEKALEFAAVTNEFRLIGDCRTPKNVRTAMKNAFTTASTL